MELNAKLAWTPCIKVSFCFAYRLDNSFLEVAERLALPNVATFSQLFFAVYVVLIIWENLFFS